MKETNPDFCTGVQILLSRMESNPEEFNTNESKWYWIMSKVVDAKRNTLHHVNSLPELTVEEIDALFDAYIPFLRKSFDDSVLREVLSAEEKELSYSVTSAPPAVLGGSNGATWSAPLIMTSNKSLTAHLTHVNQHKATLNALGLKERV